MDIGCSHARTLRGKERNENRNQHQIRNLSMKKILKWLMPLNARKLCFTGTG